MPLLGRFSVRGVTRSIHRVEGCKWWSLSLPIETAMAYSPPNSNEEFQYTPNQHESLAFPYLVSLDCACGCRCLRQLYLKLFLIVPSFQVTYSLWVTFDFSGSLLDVKPLHPSSPGVSITGYTREHSPGITATSRNRTPPFLTRCQSTLPPRQPEGGGHECDCCNMICRLLCPRMARVEQVMRWVYPVIS
jgi:hypothetical protein